MLRVPQGCAEGPEGHDTLRPYPFAGSLTLVSPETRRRSLLPGVWGCPPDYSNSLESPFVTGGLRGLVDDGHEDGAGGFRFVLPTLHVDSRLRGNDKTGAAARCRGLGCPQIPLFSSPQSRVAEKRSGSDGSLRVSLSPLFSPQDWGTKGVDRWPAGQPRQWPPALATTHREALTFYSVPDPGHRIPDTRGKQPC